MLAQLAGAFHRQSVQRGNLRHKMICQIIFSTTCEPPISGKLYHEGSNVAEVITAIAQTQISVSHVEALTILSDPDRARPSAVRPVRVWQPDRHSLRTAPF